MSKFVHGPFKNSSSAFCSTFSLPNIIPAGFHIQLFWVLLFQAKVSWAAEPDVGCNSFICGGGGAGGSGRIPPIS